MAHRFDDFREGNSRLLFLFLVEFPRVSLQSVDHACFLFRCNNIAKAAPCTGIDNRIMGYTEHLMLIGSVVITISLPLTPKETVRPKQNDSFTCMHSLTAKQTGDNGMHGNFFIHLFFCFTVQSYSQLQAQGITCVTHNM